ncbi:hypothetical protein Q5P01_004263 [Channa striata]|uniref:Uncharacterized protein n=1 Tax=Channa striata TaxID=64152 RepID=A0AA88NME8_CHASR|nr:hypothetical protein Q5P01_004263 [Channa striata]
MKGLAVVCSVGLVLATLVTTNDAWPAPLPDVWHPLGNPKGFPTKSTDGNVTEAPKKAVTTTKPLEHIWHPLGDRNGFGPADGNVTEVAGVNGGHNETVHLNATMKPDENSAGIDQTPVVEDIWTVL